VHCVRAENQGFIAIERTKSSNKIDSIIHNSKNDFLSVEDKIYLQYNFDNNLIFNGYFKHNKSILYQYNLKISSKNNYFYNIGFAKNIYKKNLFFTFNFGDVINFDKNFLIMSNSDIYQVYQMGLMFKKTFNNYSIKSEFIYNFYKNSFKDNIKYTLYYEIRKNLSSLLIFGYEFQYDFLKNTNDFANKNKMNYESLSDYLNKLHTFSLNSIFSLDELYSISLKYAINFEDTYNKIFHSFSIAFWF
jgi:hypothetical protein